MTVASHGGTKCTQKNTQTARDLTAIGLLFVGALLLPVVVTPAKAFAAEDVPHTTAEWLHPDESAVRKLDTGVAPTSPLQIGAERAPIVFGQKAPLLHASESSSPG